MSKIDWNEKDSISKLQDTIDEITQEKILKKLVDMHGGDENEFNTVRVLRHLKQLLNKQEISGEELVQFIRQI